MLILILAGLLLALIAPLLHRLREGLVVWLYSLFAAFAFAWFVWMTGPIAEGRAFFAAIPWAPSLGVQFSFYLDGLSLLFALLTSGVGVLVLLYSSAYLAEHRYRDHFFSYIFLFMMAMLGLVLANDLITLFVFWELTTLTSYLLIGFEHEHQRPRQWALQALLVTGAGGLALLAGLLLLWIAGGSSDLSTLLKTGEAIRDHSLYLPILLLIGLGAFTKSAQFPFHFWLPSAMIAPTPVSAFLHSAAMVKAGIYLLARLLPVLGGTDAWHWMVGGVGAMTMLVGALLAIGQQNLKRLLAYSTVAVLGILFLLLGIGTVSAIKAAMVYLLVHGLYKGALFMAAGAVDRATGTQEISQLGALWRSLPWVALAAVLAGMSMAGLPPMVGYIGKEFLFQAQLKGPLTPPWLTAVGVLTNGLLITAAAIFVLNTFFGSASKEERKIQRAPLLLVLGPLCLASASLVLGLFPNLVDTPLISPAATAARALPIAVEMKLWHGMSPTFFLGIGSLLLGIGVYGAWRIFSWPHRAGRLPIGGPERGYYWVIQGTERIASGVTNLLQQGDLRRYLLTVLTAVIALVAYGLMHHEAGAFPRWELLAYEGMTVAMILTGAVTAILARSMLTAVIALGAVGYGIAFLYLLFGAPDVAMAQFGVETLAVLLFILVLNRMPLFPLRATLFSRLRDGLLALTAGSLVTLLVWSVVADSSASHLSSFFLQHSVELGKGRNVVNVILVDFRSLDTLGEITVLAVAALGVFLLLAGRKGEGS